MWCWVRKCKILFPRINPYPWGRQVAWHLIPHTDSSVCSWCCVCTCPTRESPECHQYVGRRGRRNLLNSWHVYEVAQLCLDLSVYILNVWTDVLLLPVWSHRLVTHCKVQQTQAGVALCESQHMTFSLIHGSCSVAIQTWAACHNTQQQLKHSTANWWASLPTQMMSVFSVKEQVLHTQTEIEMLGKSQGCVRAHTNPVICSDTT